jgi:hypothetical protein
VSGCGTTQPTAVPLVVAPTSTPTPLASPVVVPADVSPSIVPSPSASPDAATAGRLYLAAASTINKPAKALNRKYKTFGTLTRARAFYKKAAKLERAFTDEIRKIVFPVDVVGDVKSLIRKDAALEAIYIEASTVRSWGSCPR